MKKPNSPSKKRIVTKDAVVCIEESFSIPDLLETKYFKNMREYYYRCREVGLLNAYRNYCNLLRYLQDIHKYNPQHAKSFAKRFRGTVDQRDCDAVFSEIIVYRHYIPEVYEGLIKKIDLVTRESDIVLERPDGTKAYLEIFCIMPKIPLGLNEIKTHTQSSLQSVRQKLLRKIKKQKQLSKLRDNYAVIEMNDARIAGDFSVLSSLSDGYKVTLNPVTKQVVSQGYDWTNSVFDDPCTNSLKGIIYFDLGDYSSRRLLCNPKFSTSAAITKRSARKDVA